MRSLFTGRTIDSSWNYTPNTWYCCCVVMFFGFYFSFRFFSRLFVHGKIMCDRPMNKYRKKSYYIPLLQISQGVEQLLIVALTQLNGLELEHHHFSNPIAMAVVLTEWSPRLYAEFHWWSQDVNDCWSSNSIQNVATIEEKNETRKLKCKLIANCLDVLFIDSMLV